MSRVLVGILLAIPLSGCGVLSYVPLEEPQGEVSAVRLAPSVFVRELQTTIDPEQVELTKAEWVAQLDAWRASFAQDLKDTEYPFAAEESEGSVQLTATVSKIILQHSRGEPDLVWTRLDFVDTKSGATLYSVRLETGAGAKLTSFNGRVENSLRRVAEMVADLLSGVPLKPVGESRAVPDGFKRPRIRRTS